MIEGMDVVNKIAETLTDYSDRPLEKQEISSMTVETFGVRLSGTGKNGNPFNYQKEEYSDLEESAKYIFIDLGAQRLARWWLLSQFFLFCLPLTQQ